MKELLISLDTARLAKKKGYDLIQYQTHHASFSRYHNAIDFCKNYKNKLSDDSFNIIEGTDNEGSLYSCSIILNELCYIPTHALLQKWLREIHKIHVDIYVGSDTEYGVIYEPVNNPEWIREDDDIDVLFFPTYEEALEAGLQKALTLINL